MKTKQTSKNIFTHRLVIIQLAFCLQISGILYSFSVKVAENGSKIFISLQVVVPVGEKIGQRGGSPFFVSWCTCPNLYKITCFN